MVLVPLLAGIMSYSQDVDRIFDYLGGEFARPVVDMNYESIDSLLDQLQAAIHEDIEFLASRRAEMEMSINGSDANSFDGRMNAIEDELAQDDQYIDSSDDESVATQPLNFRGGRRMERLGDVVWRDFDSDDDSDSEVEEWDDPHSTPDFVYRFWD